MKKLLFERWMGVIMASAWLVFLVFPVLILNHQPDAGRRWTGMVAIALFVPVYITSFITLGFLLEGRARGMQLLRAALLLLLTAMIEWSSTGLALSMVPFLAAYTIWGLWPPLREVATLCILVAGFVLWGLRGWPLSLLIPVAAAVLVAVTGIVGVGGMEVRIEATQQREEQLLSENRERLARDVHDLVGHTLTVANLKVQLADRFLETDPARAREELASTQHFISHAQEELRTSVNGVLQRPVGVELTAAGRSLVEAGMDVRVVGDPAAVPAPLTPVLGWVLREATTNVLRHADASRVTIQFTATSFVVADDGVGMRGPEGRGIPGMRDRAAAAGAHFQIISPPDGGCEVRVTW